jgi:hypothetical protein
LLAFQAACKSPNHAGPIRNIAPSLIAAEFLSFKVDENALLVFRLSGLHRTRASRRASARRRRRCTATPLRHPYS